VIDWIRLNVFGRHVYNSTDINKPIRGTDIYEYIYAVSVSVLLLCYYAYTDLFTDLRFLPQMSVCVLYRVAQIITDVHGLCVLRIMSGLLAEF